MAKLKITRANGEVSEHKLTPGVEYAFELKRGMGIGKALRLEEKSSDLYWLAWETLRKAGGQVSLSFEEFLDSLLDVEVIDEEKK